MIEYRLFPSHLAVNKFRTRLEHVSNTFLSQFTFNSSNLAALLSSSLELNSNSIVGDVAPIAAPIFAAANLAGALEFIART